MLEELQHVGMGNEVDLMYNLAEIACWKIDNKGNILWSDNLCKFYGVSQDYDGKTVEDFESRVFPSDFARFERLLTDSLACLSPFEIKVRLKRYDSYRWVRIKGQVNVDGSLTGCTQDIDNLYREAFANKQKLNVLEALIKSNGVDLEDLKKVF